MANGQGNRRWPHPAASDDEPDVEFEELSSYLALDTLPVRPSRPVRTVRPSARARLAAAVHDSPLAPVVAVLGDLAAGYQYPVSKATAATGVTMTPTSYDSLVVVHRMPGRMDEMTERISTWWTARQERLRSPFGAVHLSPAATTAPEQIALWRGHIRPVTSLVPVPAELVLEPWSTIGLVATIRPVRHVVQHIGWHRRWAWFATGHALLDQATVVAEQRRRRSG